MLTLSLPKTPAAAPSIDSDLRMQALERLYRRRSVIDNLIQALELYRGDADAEDGAGSLTSLSK
jgi:hypothetical protein